MTDNSKEASMNEIKPVYQRLVQLDEWVDITKEEYVECVCRETYEARILYPAAALEAQAKRIAELESDLQEYIDAQPNI